MKVRVGPIRWVLVAAAIAATTVVAGCTSPNSGVITEPVESPVPAITSSTSTATSVETESSSTPPEAPIDTSSELSSPEASSSASSWPADFTPEQQEIAKSALAAITGFTETVAKANADPGQDWTAGIRTYAADPAATLSLQSIQSLATAGVHATAPSVYENPSVQSAEDIRAVVEVCVDSSRTTLVDADGVLVLGPPDMPRSVVTYTVVRYSAADGGWLVTETAGSDPVRTC